MEVVHYFMFVVFLLMSLITIFILFPMTIVFKLLRYFKRTINMEYMAGKVVLITGASSGIGEHLAYEYARRGARLALGARREGHLREVSKKARQLGSPDVIVIPMDVSRVEDCKSFISKAVSHFGQVDHLVNNAGIAQSKLFEETADVTDLARIMDVNFWGSAYCTHFALPHLKKTNGKIVAIASMAAWIPTPKLSVYSASKAAMVGFYESLRQEIGSSVGVTIAALGVIQSEITSPQFLSAIGINLIQPKSTESCAKAIVDGACKGERYVTEPTWNIFFFLFKSLCPELLDWSVLWQVTLSSSKKHH